MSGSATPPLLTVSNNGIGVVPDKLLNTFVQGSALLADLRYFTGISNMNAWMIGTVAQNDGGQGMFVWNSSSTAADDGGLTVIAPAGLTMGRWIRQSGIRVSGPIPSTINMPVSVVSTGQIILTSGSVAAPKTTPTDTIVGALYSSYGPGAGRPNAQQGAVVGLARLYGSNAARNANVRAFFGEVVDYIGNTGIVSNPNFTEGARFQSVAFPGVSYSQTGNVSYSAGAAGLPYLYTLGWESEADNLWQDAPTIANFNDLQFITSFLATSAAIGTGTYKNDAGFMTNPFSRPAQTGFFVPNGSVSDSAFGSNATVTWGLNLIFANTTFGAIGIPNNSQIRGMNAAGTAQYALLAIDGINNLLLGSDARLAQVSLATSSVVTLANGPLRTAKQFILTAMTAPGTPPSGQFFLFMDTSDNKLKAIGPSGTTTTIANP